MALEIQLLSRYQLRTSDDDNMLLELPSIELAPIGEKLPHLTEIVCSVSGTPSELAAQIESVYKKFSSDNPIQLSVSRKLKHENCRLNQPLPPGVNCTLRIQVGYFDSDAAGNPDRSVPQEITAECYLSTPPEPNDEPPPIIDNGKYPGWLAIDLGTSNSTVTLFEPKRVPSIDSLPKEQEQRLRERLAQWLSQSAADALPDVSTSEWEEFVHLIGQDFEIETSRLSDLILNVDSYLLLKVIRQIELSSGIRSESFRKAVSKRLNQIYHEVFRVPPLEWQSLIPVTLDPIRRLTEIPSELKIVSLEPSLRVLMGERARQERNDAVITATSNTWNDIKGKFHHSPKRYFGQDRSFKVTFEGKEENIGVSQLIQSAYAHLIQLTEEARQKSPDSFSKWPFKRAVVTYPAIAPLVVRREIDELFRNLGIDDISTSYDEAVSVAIFYLWREFGGDLNIGIESFKSRCYPEGDKWIQNVLVLDIGGGTTDLALIRFTLEEEPCDDLFKEEEDRGKGGRYYILTPKLLGSSGHLQLGGELITLRIFELLKAAIADCLLTAVSEERLQSSTLNNRLTELDERFLTKDAKFRSGSILGCVENGRREGDSAYTDALDAAEKIIPTRWAYDPSRLDRFYTLWDYAEEAKITLGKKPETSEQLSPPFVLPWVRIEKLLESSQIEGQTQDDNTLSVTLTNQQFERAIMPILKEVIELAKGLMENRLEELAEERTDAKSQHKQVDWLILSGKTCNLSLVEREIHREFSKSDYFVWNPERVTYVPEYSKIATSAGACYAEKLRRLIFAPEASTDMIVKGANQLLINIKNLSFYLPCSFKLLALAKEPLTIFKANQELFQLEPHSSISKARSKSIEGVSLSMNIYREDFEGKTLQYWGNYDGQALARQLHISDPEFREEIKVIFEIDSKLEFNLLLYRRKAYRLIASDVPHIDLKDALAKVFSEPNLPAIISDEHRFPCDICVNVAESATVHKNGAHKPVFEGGKDYSESIEIFWDDDNQNSKQKQGLIVPLPPFPLSGKHTFYIPNPETKEWIRIGELIKPSDKIGYPRKYYVALDEEGILRIYAGEVPYWTSDDPDCLQKEGCVFRDQLQIEPKDADQTRDPFSGFH